MIPFLMAAVLPAAALAQSQAGAQSSSGAQTQPAGGSGVPSIAIPKTTEVHRHRDSKAGCNAPTSHGGYTGRD